MIIMADQYTRSLLLFTDKNNPLKDECGFEWEIKTGTIEIVDMKDGNFTKAAYFDHAYAEMIPNFELGGDIDFTIDCYFKTASTSMGDSLYSITNASSGTKYGIGTFYHSEASYQLEYWGSLNSTYPIYYHPTHAEFQQYFCHYVMEYVSKEKKMYCFLNGELVNNEYPMNVPKFIPTKIFVGHHHWSNISTFTGWMYFFRISATARWLENYDLKEALLLPYIFDLERIILKVPKLENDTERKITGKYKVNFDTLKDVKKQNDILFDVKRLIAMNIIHITDTKRKVVINNILLNDLVRSIRSKKQKIIATVFNPKYRLIKNYKTQIEMLQQVQNERGKKS